MFEQEVVTRAQGVFLWVALASQSLLRGFTNADRICDLQERLRLLPPTLEEYFQHMLDSVEEVYRRMTVQAFQICLQAEEPLPLMTYSFLDELADFDLHAKIRPLKPKEIEDRLEYMRRRLDARTKGLLEVAESTRSIRGPFFSFHVDFLHRTARDFVKTRDVQQMLNPYLPEHFNVNLSLIKAFLSQLKSLPPSDDSTADGPLYGLLSLLMTCDHALELDSDISEDKILHILAETEKVVLSRPHQFMKGKRTAFPGQLVQLGHLPYIRWRISQNPSLISSKSNPFLGRPLLDFALHFPIPGDSPLLAEKLFSSDREREEMIQCLLDAGANPNERYRDATVWERFVLSAHTGDYFRDYSPSLVFQIAKILVEHGAPLSKSIVVSKQTKTIPSIRLREDADYVYEEKVSYRKVEIESVKTAGQILIDSIGARAHDIKVLDLYKIQPLGESTRWPWFGLVNSLRRIFP